MPLSDSVSNVSSSSILVKILADEVPASALLRRGTRPRDSRLCSSEGIQRGDWERDMMKGEGLLDPSPNISPSSCDPAAASTGRIVEAERFSGGGEVEAGTMTSFS